VKNLKILLPFLIILCFSSGTVFSQENISTVEVTDNVVRYATDIVKPILDSNQTQDRLSLLIKVSEILHDPEKGIDTNRIEPKDFMIYDKLNSIRLGFLVTRKRTSRQKQILKSWHSKYMRNSPANVFFAPTADDIIQTKAAFGCSHYARAFMAVVKALDLIDNPKDLRYVVSSKSDDYNKALEQSDKQMTINGHQFVLVKSGSQWIAINTSQSEYTIMPDGFSPDNIGPPQNVSVRFSSYPQITFLLRKIGQDFNDDCEDDSLSALMNISRSGHPKNSDFKWDKFIPETRADLHQSDSL
jgi:branched-subunit amino acid transport protein